ncbi:hypothetical protein M8J77_024238 [Diaphorina citri]|nr:hypothetical protein M8J77_024238 [Diaphorina citri]
MHRRQRKSVKNEFWTFSFSVLVSHSLSTHQSSFSTQEMVKAHPHLITCIFLAVLSHLTSANEGDTKNKVPSIPIHACAERLYQVRNVMCSIYGKRDAGGKRSMSSSGRNALEELYADYGNVEDLPMIVGVSEDGTPITEVPYPPRMSAPRYTRLRRFQQQEPGLASLCCTQVCTLHTLLHYC